MSFNGLFYTSLIIFSLGLFYRISGWFRYSLDAKAGGITPGKRVYAAIRGILLTLFSAKISILVKVFVVDVLFQARTFSVSRLRWFMHMCMFGGFTGLLFMHALDKFITHHLFADYYPTLNPFLFLRNLFAALVLTGLVLAAYRRFFHKEPRLFTNSMDYVVMILLGVIMVSGILLEGAKISSHTRYQDMVEEYSDLDEGELVALESYWINDFGVASPNVKGPFEKNTLALGYEVHEENCAACHSPPQWALLSYGASKIAKPVFAAMDRRGLPTLLWYIHFLACFIGLAYIPFSKMFHMFVSPLSLLANAVMDRASDPANILTKQMMELDACMHCGSCTLQCAVGISYEAIPNVYILPSEKISAVKALAAGKKLSAQELMTIQRGLVLCTNCYRCTEACPVGINLQDLWFDVREALLQKKTPEFLLLSTLSLYRGNKSEEMIKAHYQEPLHRVRQAIDDACSLASTTRDTVIGHRHLNKGFKRLLALSSQGYTSAACFTCKTCTLACPVVHNFENPRKALGLMPHQIIHAANMGLTDLAFSSRMLWSCLGCYECQEHCPQGVEVADVFYELKMLAINRFTEKH
ncbi:4Fe-4S dicluster domain-containing protein [Thermodesulfobacteriota bacterium]